MKEKEHDPREQDAVRREREREALRDERARAAAEESRAPSRDEWERRPPRDEVHARDADPRRETEARRGPEQQPRRGEAPAAGEPLLGPESASFREEWEAIQAAFVDEPRQAVERADKLVARAAQRIADRFGNERQRLEEQWGSGGDVGTEDLRQALRRYRAFFDRLLSI